MSSFSPFTKEQLMPQPEMLEINKQKSELFIGIPKETNSEEKRICLNPDAVSALVAHGHRVVIETGAGEGANYTDKQYADAGAKISYNVKEAFQCSIVLKVSPPSLEEIKFMNTKAFLISAMQLKTQQKQFFEALNKKKITAIAFGFIKDEHGVFPVVKSLSEIAGTASVHIAAELMSNSKQGNGLLFGNIGGVPPTEVVILGAGTVGEFAAKAALGLGARVKVFDNSITKLRRLQQQVHSPIYTSTVQPKTLVKALMRCNVVIGAMRGKERSPVIVNTGMIERMKDGAVIVDVSIDRGGCFETSRVTTHSNPTFRAHGVIHYCVPNILSRYSRTASVSLSNMLTPYLLYVAEEGGIEIAARCDNSLRNGIYTFRGILTNETIGKWFNVPYRDINLLII